MGKPSAARVTAFGKVHFGPDFIGPIIGEQQISFAEWLDEGIDYVGEGAPWREGFQRSAPLAFLFHAPAKLLARVKSAPPSVLLGVVSPSEDSIGRPFPFSVLTELRDPAYGAGAAALPVAAERFIADAAGICALARTVASPAMLLEEAERQAPPHREECALAARDLRAWTLQEGVMSKLWPLLFPRDGARGASRALRVLVDSVVPMRAHGALATGRSVRLPLGRGGAAAATFWIDIVRVLAGWSETFPAAFWPADRADGDLIVCLGDASPPLFAQLWGTPPADPRVLDASSEAQVDDRGNLMAELDRVVAEPRGKVGELLALLGEVAEANGSSNDVR